MANKTQELDTISKTIKESEYFSIGYQQQVPEKVIFFNEAENHQK